MSENSRGRGKKIIAPRGRGRRTQAERDQVAQAERERNKERDDQYRQEQEAVRLKAEREARDLRHRAAQRARGRGRGGFMGESTRPETESSGPLAGGSVIGSQFSTGQSFPRPWAPSGRPGARGSTKISTIEVKQEGAISSASRAPAGPDFLFSNIVPQDVLDGGYISSDLDEADQGRRKPIEEISLLTDDEDEAGPITTRGAPIVLTRIVHRGRAPPVNPDAADGTFIKPDEDGDVTMIDDTTSSAKKGKQRAKDVEIVEERPFRGVWHDPDDTEIKKEPAIDEPRAKITDLTKDTDETPPDAKSRNQRHPSSKPVPPMLNTEEERNEYSRQQISHAMLVQEFGSIQLEKEPRNYVFQFPPILPNLSKPQAIIIKDDPDNPAPAPEPTPELTSTNTKETAIKVEEGASEKPLRPPIPAGAVGKLRVHKSGKMTLNWGGMSFIVSNGVAPQFLQQVVMVKMNEPESAQVGGFARPRVDGVVGDAMAFGQPRGKLIVTPDWDDLMQ